MRSKNKGRDYIFIYLFDNIIILNNFTREFFFELINNKNLFKIIIQFIEFNFFINI